jgi:hypothetical protein
MKKEASFNLEDIYYNMDGEANEEQSNQEQSNQEQYNKQLLQDQSSKKNIISFYCTYIYNYLINWFYPSHINSLYQ